MRRIAVCTLCNQEYPLGAFYCGECETTLLKEREAPERWYDKGHVSTANRGAMFAALPMLIRHQKKHWKNKSQGVKNIEW